MFRAMLMLVLSMGSTAQATEEFIGEGTVDAIKFKEQKLTITHAVIKELENENTRDFAVLDPGMLEEVQVGNKIKFSVSRESDGSLVITDFEMVAAPSPTPTPPRSKKR